MVLEAGGDMVSARQCLLADVRYARSPAHSACSCEAASLMVVSVDASVIKLASHVMADEDGSCAHAQSTRRSYEPSAGMAFRFALRVA